MDKSFKSTNESFTRQDRIVRYKKFEDKLEKLKLEALDRLTLLTQEALIDEKENTFISFLLNDRTSHLKALSIECYSLTLLGSFVVNSRNNLEERYKLLEELFQKGKINTSVYENTMEQIKIDLNIIEIFDNLEDKYQLDESIFNKIIDLNKKKIIPEIDQNLVKLVIELNR